MIKFPSDWVVLGNIENLDCLEEDLIQGHSPNLKYILDIGWVPQGNPNGKFICKLVVYENWDPPVTTFSTTDKQEAIHWANKTLEAYNG